MFYASKTPRFGSYGTHGDVSGYLWCQPETQHSVYPSHRMVRVRNTETHPGSVWETAWVVNESRHP